MVVLALALAILAMIAPATGARSRTHDLAAQVFRALGLTIPTGYSSDGSAGNRAVARRDAPSLVAQVKLPAGANPLTSEPHGDNGYLKPQRVLEGDLADITARGWWQVSGEPSQVIGFVEAHPPAGARQSGGGGGGNRRTGTSELSVSFQWPAVAGVLGSRMVTVTATSLPNGNTGVLAESQSDWVVLRPSSERISAQVRSVSLTSIELHGRAPSIAATVTGRSRVRAIVRLINSLPVAQPTVYMCPAEMDPRLVKIAFRGAGGAPLAVLTYMDFRPWLGPSLGCGPIDLTIGGRRQHPLLGGDFLKTLTKLVGRTLL